MRTTAHRVLGPLALTLMLGCSPSGPCNEDVPFSLEHDLDQAEASRLATALGVTSIDGMCDATCSELEDEFMSPDGATFSVMNVETCSLVMPSTDDMGMEVRGFLRCSGTGARCR